MILVSILIKADAALLPMSYSIRNDVKMKVFEIVNRQQCFIDISIPAVLRAHPLFNIHTYIHRQNNHNIQHDFDAGSPVTLQDSAFSASTGSTLQRMQY